MPEVVDKEFVQRYVSVGSMKVPVGVETASLEINYFDFSKLPLSYIQSDSNEHIRFSSAFIDLIAGVSKLETEVFDPDNLLTRCDSAKYYTSKKEIEAGIDDLFNLILERHNGIKDAEEISSSVEYEARVIFISSLSTIKELLDDERNEKLGLILEKCSEKMNVRIIIAETSKNISSYNFEKWYKSNVSASDAVWIGNGIADQYYLKIGKSIPEMNDDISNEYGFSIVKGRPVKIKVLSDMEGK